MEKQEDFKKLKDEKHSTKKKLRNTARILELNSNVIVISLTIFFFKRNRNALRQTHLFYVLVKILGQSLC